MAQSNGSTRVLANEVRVDKMTKEKNYSRHWAYKVPVSKSNNSYNRSRFTPVAAVYIKAAVVGRQNNLKQ